MLNYLTPVKCVSNLLPLPNGFAIPQLGFGTSKLSYSHAEEMVEYAVKCGFRHIDCAQKYNNQSEIGRAIDKLAYNKYLSREDLFITSNIWWKNDKLNVIREDCCNSLQELHLDYLDMCVLHWPDRVCNKYFGKRTSNENDLKQMPNDNELDGDNKLLLSCWKEMNKLVEKKLVRSIAVANCNEEQLQNLISDETTRSPVINQIEWHPCHVNYSLQIFHQQNQILTGALCPLGIANSNLTNNAGQSILEDSTIKIMAERFGFTPARLLLNWNAFNGNVIIISSANKEHIKDNAKTERYAVHDAARIVLDSYHRFVRSYQVLCTK